MSDEFFDRFNRFNIGFERMFDNMLMDRSNYPPHNIIKVDDNTYHLEMAVAGFNEEELSVQVEGGVLSITGKKITSNEGTYIHRGLSMRDFSKKFTLGDHMYVNRARVSAGILAIEVMRVIPEEARPKTIPLDGRRLLETSTT